MQIFIANIDSISKNPEAYSELLLSKHKTRLSKFHNQTRKLQFILGHLIADNCGATYTSITHKDKLVVVAAAADAPVGIDIENTSIKRDFAAASELMNLAKPKSSEDFYKLFTKTEAVYKLGQTPKCTKFISYGEYLICIVATCDFDTPSLQNYDINSILTTKKE